MELFSQKKIQSNVLYLSVILILAAGSFAYAASDDRFLAEQSVNDPTMTPQVISQVKKDSQTPIPEQLQKHQTLAEVNSKQIKKDVLESNAVSDYEIKRKTDPAKLLAVEKHEYVPNKPGKAIYLIEYENKNVRIGTDFK